MTPSHSRYYSFLEMINRRDEPPTTTSSEESDALLIDLDTTDSTSPGAEKQMVPLSDSEKDRTLELMKENQGHASVMMPQIDQDRAIAGRIAAWTVNIT